MASLNVRLAGIAVVCAVVAACSARPAPQPSVSAPAPKIVAAPAPGLQGDLDRHGVPLRVPQSGKAILVNIPSYEMIALEDGEEVFRSRVIVGAAHTDRQTPLMDTYTSVARFRPTWRPTPTMIATGAYQDGVRRAGRRNPLGLVALRLQPGLLIYLHDTNKPKLFEREARALSWGCVRVQDWERLIAWTLDIEPADVQVLANGPRTVDVETAGLPVLIRYYTAFPDAAGELRFHEDIYGLGETRLAPQKSARRAASAEMAMAVVGD